ncbi:MAG: hypothetical protein O3A51_07180 [Verrucomicrobia bacterium]|nr:hypothetical protein [Verrucomicrobiota bacterium]
MEHEMYDIEAAERQTPKQQRANLISMDEEMALTDRERLMIESAYRRGFTQGYQQAMADEQAGINTRLAREGYLRWRFARHGGQFQIPDRRRSV